MKMVGVLDGGIAVDSGMTPKTILCCLVPAAGALI